MVLVSGRDDHGLLAQHAIDLLSAPDRGRAVASVEDGTLVAVLAGRDSWLRVRTLVGPPAGGWINDFHLRGIVHVVGADGCPARAARRAGAPARTTIPRNEQAELRAVTLGNRHYVAIRTLRDRRRGWVTFGDIREIPDRGRPPASCR